MRKFSEQFATGIVWIGIGAIASIWLYDRIPGGGWMRTVQAAGWLIVLSLGMHIRVLLHESGHLLAAQLLRMNPLQVQIGTGFLLWRYRSPKGLTWHWRLYPAGGVVYTAAEREQGFKWRYFLVTAAGPLTDALILCIVYNFLIQAYGGLAAAFLHNVAGLVLFALFWFTVVSAVTGLVPHRVYLGTSGLHTDGYWLFRLLRLSDTEAMRAVREAHWQRLIDLARSA